MGNKITLSRFEEELIIEIKKQSLINYKRIYYNKTNTTYNNILKIPFHCLIIYCYYFKNTDYLGQYIDFLKYNQLIEDNNKKFLINYNLYAEYQKNGDHYEETIIIDNVTIDKNKNIETLIIKNKNIDEFIDSIINYLNDVINKNNHINTYNLKLYINNLNFIKKYYKINVIQYLDVSKLNDIHWYHEPMDVEGRYNLLSLNNNIYNKLNDNNLNIPTAPPKDDL